MAKLTLLEIVQQTLNDMDSDEVNSIEDTVEAQQIASIARDCYNEMISNRNWPHLQRLIKLDSSLDVTKPTHFKLPNEVKELSFFKYDKRKTEDAPILYQDVEYKHPDDFLRRIQSRNSTHDNVQTITDYSGTTLLIFDNFAPQYWTSFDDLHIVCDGFNSDIDDTLKQSKTQCLAYMEPVWIHTDSAIPDLPSEAFSAFLSEVKSSSFFVLKQMVNTKEEQKSARQQRWLSRKAWRAAGGVRYDNFGRKARK